MHKTTASNLRSILAKLADGSHQAADEKFTAYSQNLDDQTAETAWLEAHAFREVANSMGIIAASVSPETIVEAFQRIVEQFRLSCDELFNVYVLVHSESDVDDRESVAHDMKREWLEARARHEAAKMMLVPARAFSR